MNVPGAKRWPDFLLIGAPKAGTTALFKALAGHHQVCASEQKEPRFFICSGSRPQYPCPGGKSNSASIVYPEETYLALFRDCPENLVAGEASTAYLHHPEAPANAFSKVPGARIICVLRHPVDRAYSQWLHLKQEGYEDSPDFETAWNREPEYKALGWRPAFYWQERGFYARHLERWLAYFPREAVLILFYEDWLQRPLETLNQICGHLGVEGFDSPKLTMENVSSRQPRWKWLHHKMVRDNELRNWAQRHLPLWLRDAITIPVRRINLKPGPSIDPELRTRLAVIFHDDITKLEAMSGRNLDHWRV